MKHDDSYTLNLLHLLVDAKTLGIDVFITIIIIDYSVHTSSILHIVVMLLH